jgi:hypothetical protein
MQISHIFILPTNFISMLRYIYISDKFYVTEWVFLICINKVCSVNDLGGPMYKMSTTFSYMHPPWDVSLLVYLLFADRNGGRRERKSKAISETGCAGNLSLILDITSCLGMQKSSWPAESLRLPPTAKKPTQARHHSTWVASSWTMSGSKLS